MAQETVAIAFLIFLAIVGSVIGALIRSQTSPLHCPMTEREGQTMSVGDPGNPLYEAEFCVTPENPEVLAAQQMRRQAEERERLLQKARACPQCGTPAARLSWVYFITSPETWQNSCGRA